MSIPYGWLLAAIIFSALPIAAVKQYNVTNDHKWLVFAILSQLLLILAYIQITKNSDISIAYSLIKITSIILVVLISIFIFSEPLTAKHIVGVLLGMLAIYTLSS